MSKRAPSTAQLLVIAGFALSCFGILLFLWVTFGGPTPFRAQPYELKVPFNEATQLAEQSDVRISGVNVGKVRNIALAPNGDRHWRRSTSTTSTRRCRSRRGRSCAPRRCWARPTSNSPPASKDGPRLADGGTLPEANVAESVQLDEIFRTFDPETRAAFQSWMQEAAVAINGQAQGLSYAFGELEPTFAELDKLFRVLDTQRLAVTQLFRNGATTFEALRGREGELASLIQTSNAVFQTTAQRDRDIEALFRAFPTFQDESRLTLNRLKAFAVNANPLMKQLVPAAEELSPTLVAFANLAPEAKGFFEGLAPVIARAPTGFPALRRLFRDDFPPLLRAVDPFLRNLNPVLTGLNLYKREFTSVFANVAAASNAVLPIENDAGERFHYLRAMGPLNPESVSTYPSRLNINRNSAYSPPLWAKDVVSGLPSFNASQCNSGITATLDSAAGTSDAFKERTAKGETKEAEDLFNRIKKYAFAEQSGTSSVPAPGCTQQAPLDPIYGSGAASAYQRTFEQTGE